MAGPWDVVSVTPVAANGGRGGGWDVVSQEPVQREWADVPGEALRNLPSSALNFGKALVEPILSPVQTAKALGTLATGFISKTGRPGDFLRVGDAEPTAEELARRQRDEAGADAVAKFYKDRYGSMEGIKNTVATDPLGAAADLATVLTLGGGALANAPGTVGQVGRGIQTAGRVIDPVNAVIEGTRLAGKGVGYVASSALGRTTGVGGGTVRQAARAGMEGGDTAKVFRENMRGADPAAMVDMADSALDQMRAARSAEYQSGMSGVRADPTVLDMKPVVDAFAKTMEVGSYKGKVINRSAGKVQQEIFDVLTEWKNLDPTQYHTAEGFDALKRTIGDIRENTAPHTPSRVVADRVYNAIKGEIEAQAPQYAKTMADYASASDQLKQLQKSFSRTATASDETAVNKLLATARNNVTANYSMKQKQLQELAKYEPNLPAAIAGQTLNSMAPRGLTANLAGTGGLAFAVSNPALAAAAPVFMPRVVGEAAYGTGVAMRPLTKIDRELLRKGGLLGFQAGRAEGLL